MKLFVASDFIIFIIFYSLLQRPYSYRDQQGQFCFDEAFKSQVIMNISKIVTPEFL